MGWVVGLWVLMSIGIGWWWYKEKQDKTQEKRGVPRGSLGWPFVGETLHFISSLSSSRPVSFFEKRKSLYGKVFKSHLLGRPVIVSTDPELNKVILQNQKSAFLPYYPKSVLEVLGESSVFLMNGNLHKRVHTAISSFMRSPSLKAHITRLFENNAKLSMATWKDKPLVYVQDEAKEMAFRVLVKVLLSIGPGEDYNLVKREFEAKEKLMRLINRIIEERRPELCEPEEKGAGRDAVDVLLRDPEIRKEARHLPSDFISHNMVEMMIPGETVTAALTLSVKFLGDSPVALNRLVEENMELKRTKDQSGTEFTWMDYVSLPFTQKVINETLRMANIIISVWRRALQDVEIKGYFIPKDWCVVAAFLAPNMDEKTYDNPYHFDPWRWEGKDALVNTLFTPFGGGQRLCPGHELARLQIAIFLHHLVTTYRWVAKEDVIVNFPTVQMKRKLPITVTPISPSS
ncbi:Cytochrome P450 [Dillenia turbinata]|uniref:Cytochrome P450 n=1 Tax=Dillenia turbinata TaxID=194707 RepID=A0AAN8UWN0_9MAGN